MKAILFFDNWMLERNIGFERVIGQPTFLGELLPDAVGCHLDTIFFDSRLDKYVLYLRARTGLANGDFETFAFRLESERPDQWELPPINPDISPVWKAYPNVLGDMDTGEPIVGVLSSAPSGGINSNITPLAGTPLADRGYASIYLPYSTERQTLVAFARDGLRFRIDREHPWLDDQSDTWTGIVYDPRTATFNIFSRPGTGDRRESVVSTKDFETFSQPLVVMQADFHDPPLTEIYGLPNFPYEDMFVGFPWLYTASPFEPRRLKMEGRVVSELAYSYNDLIWYRTDRRPFVPLRPVGELGGGSLYVRSVVRTQDGRILLYANANRSEHGSVDFRKWAGKDTVRPSGTFLYELRQDGFCYLVTAGREAWLRTRPIIPRSKELTLNVRTAPHSRVRVQLVESGEREGDERVRAMEDIVSGMPIPGYSFDDCIPIVGDHTAVAVRWKEHPDLSELIGRPIRIEIQAFEAELYAVRLDCLGYWSHAEVEHLG